MLQALDPLTLELTAGATFFTDNTDFLGGRTRSQDPLYSIQGHAIYSFGSGIWASADANYFTGGRTAMDGEASNELQRNWRLGATLSFPLDTSYSVRLYGSSGVSARTENRRVYVREVSGQAAKPGGCVTPPSWPSSASGWSSGPSGYGLLAGVASGG